MTKFTDAIETFKKRISEIGEKEYTINNDWLNKPHDDSNYTENALQALWNIAETLRKAAIAFSSKIYLGLEYNNLSNWFHYLEPGTGTLQVIDKKTYDAGIALRDFFVIATADGQAKSMLTGAGIDRLKGILCGLNERLQQYEQKGITEQSLIDYERRLTDFVHNQSIPSLPDFILNNDGILSLQINLSTLEDEASRLEADKLSYDTLIEELQDLLRNLATQKSSLLKQHEQFNGTYPLPAEASVFQDRFVAAREIASQQLFEIHQKANAFHAQVHTLLEDTKKKQKAAIKLLNQDAGDNRRELIEQATQALSSAEATAEASYKKYMQEKAAILLMTPTKEQTLSEIVSNAAVRQKYLVDAIQDLKRIKNKLSATPPVVPAYADFTAIFITDSGTLESQQQILAMHQQATASLTVKPKQKINLFGSTKAPVKVDPIKELIGLVNRKLKEFETENLIDITIPATTTGTTEVAAASLYAFQREYYAEQQLNVKIDAQRKQLEITEIQSRQDNLVSRQAFLRHMLTKFEFGLADIQTSKEALTTSLAALDDMSLDDALVYFDEMNDNWVQLQEWFDTKPQGEEQFYHDVPEALVRTFDSQHEQWLQLQGLCSNISTALPEAVLATNVILQQEKDQLQKKISTTNERYQNLQQLNAALATKKEALQLQKLAAIATTNKLLLDQITDANKLCIGSKRQLLTALHQQLHHFSNLDEFLENLESSKHPQIIEKMAQIHADSEALTRFTQAVQSSVNASSSSNLHMLQLENIYFGPTLNRVGGIFGNYLQERANTYLIQDLWGRLASFVFSYFRFKSAAEERTEYLSDLQKRVIKYQATPGDYQDLIAFIDQGQHQFSPRAIEGEKYGQSLHKQLSKLRRDLTAIHAQTISMEAELEALSSPQAPSS